MISINEVIDSIKWYIQKRRLKKITQFKSINDIKKILALTADVKIKSIPLSNLEMYTINSEIATAYNLLNSLSVIIDNAVNHHSGNILTSINVYPETINLLDYLYSKPINDSIYSYTPIHTLLKDFRDSLNAIILITDEDSLFYLELYIPVYTKMYLQLIIQLRELKSK